MKKAAAAVTFTIIVFQCVFSSGCASMFEKEYLYVSDFIAEAPDETGDYAVEVTGFNELKSAVTRFVIGHADVGKVEFRNYDGNINADLAEACWQVKSENAFGAYAVNYISYDVNHIISYYAADIYINYRHTKEELSGIATAENITLVAEYLRIGLERFDTVILLLINNRLLTADDIKEHILELYYGDPLMSPVLPVAEINSYPEKGAQRIFETRFDYFYGRERLGEMKAGLAGAVLEFSSSLDEVEPVFAAMEACIRLSEMCDYIHESDSLPASSEPSTAYGALIENAADGLGFAMAYKALCDAVSVECHVVLGRMDKAPHAWNIIKIEDEYYHVDVSQCSERGIEGVFLTGDSDMWGRYLWDTEKYPECEGSLSYYIITDPQMRDDEANPDENSLDN